MPTKSIKAKNYVKKKINFLLKNLDFIFEYFFIGFIIGNIFGSFLVFFRPWFIWDGLLMICLILILESGNYLFFKISKKQKKFHSYLSIRTGLLIGFFIDAYKVGS
uniref:Ycf20 n=1 Tax=Bryopsis sp. HV04063 TaxID=1979421 RepID=A0A2P0QIU7_9CHLO|nr:hypothetical protein [Bryopsis sp. HV04063]ARO74128.1 hypothetical protein [Bryopsis sp. HV04063]